MMKSVDFVIYYFEWRDIIGLGKSSKYLDSPTLYLVERGNIKQGQPEVSVPVLGFLFALLRWKAKPKGR